MNGYIPLFESIVGSSIWSEDPETCKIWITMIVVRDRDHVVPLTIPGIADMSRVPLKKTEQVIEKFLGPDPYSNSQEFGGRRIQKVDRGFLILNGKKFQEMMAEQNRRARWRRAQAAKRDRSGKGVSRRETEYDRAFGDGGVE